MILDDGRLEGESAADAAIGLGHARQKRADLAKRAPGVAVDHFGAPPAFRPRREVGLRKRRN